MRHKRRHFNTREEWADFAVRVLRGNRGEVTVNCYRWVVGQDLQNGLWHAQKLGLVKDCGGRPDRRVYELTEKGKAWKVLPPKQRQKPQQKAARPATAPPSRGEG